MTNRKSAPGISPALVHLRYRRTVPVVDRDDNLLGIKTWDELTGDDIHRASYLWVTNSQGLVLLAQRAYTLEHNPGLWSTAVTGTVMVDQTYESNMRDEAAEEIGLRGVDFGLGPKILLELPNGNSHMIQWFTAVVDRVADDFRLDQTEVRKLRWVHLHQMAEEVGSRPKMYSPAVPLWLPTWLNS